MSGVKRLVALVVVGMLAAACSGGGGGDKGDNAIVLGMINQEDAPIGSFPEAREAAQAAVAHVNEDLGGVDGRPLRLEVCRTTGTPESSAACANSLLEKRPVAVLGGVDLGAAASLPVFEKAGVPYIGGAPALGEELTSSAAWMTAGGVVADLLGQADYALGTLKVKKVGALYVDLPGVLTTVIGAAEIVLRAKGVTDVKLVPAKADAADFAPSVKAATAGNPDAVIVLFPAQSCARIMSAARSLNVRARTFYPSACASQAVVDAAGPAAENAYFASAYLPFDDPSPEVATWKAEAKVSKPSALSQAGFSVAMNVYDLLKDGTDTPAELNAKLRATANHPGYMAHPYTCDRKQVSLLPAVCNPHVRLLQYKGGKFVDITGRWVSGADLVKLFG
ncbi:MAG: Branched-chain amino acid ABC transporter, amino acid-binding protein [uncultured Acidimicrobiales bacterium]|uniref:Branched-chain amino acid ABC transporter, amino acid-binding protein n=1 Tax=uncultured Acidimicrobiales bacterium TaxID=310071 RepID=A0A6J4HKN3_9ACTN|nr:MAG: Branched-chain amino acid ABC transporter, amino acid-binding protein [uncultured Acidimicrobiales bacterium]